VTSNPAPAALAIPCCRAHVDDRINKSSNASPNSGNAGHGGVPTEKTLVYGLWIALVMAHRGERIPLPWLRSIAGPRTTSGKIHLTEPYTIPSGLPCSLARASGSWHTIH